MNVALIILASTFGWQAIPTHLRPTALFSVEPFKSLVKSDYLELMKPPSVWVRMLLYDSAPDQVDAKFTEQLLKDLREIRTPIPRESISRLLKELDFDSYAVRVSAANKLVLFREPVIPTIHKVLEDSNCSADMRHHLSAVIRRVENLDPTPFEQRMLEYLRPNERHLIYPQYRERILQALAENIPESWIAKEAKKHLETANRMEDSYRKGSGGKLLKFAPIR